MPEDERASVGGFRVNDRRRFSPETGEPRDVDCEAQTERQEAEPGDAYAGREGAAFASGSQTGDLSFSSFIFGLSTQVLMLLGEVQPPTGEPVNQDVGAARQLIDILAMLQEKTRGNLESTEQSMLQEMLYNLRMRYVEVTRSAKTG